MDLVAMAIFLADVVGKEAIIGGNEAWSDDTNVRSTHDDLCEGIEKNPQKEWI